MKNKKENHITAFYIETLMLVAVFITIILILTQTFAIARSKSFEARAMTDGVCLAKNAAEAVAVSDSQEALFTLLNEEGNAAQEEGAIVATYNGKMQPATENVVYEVRVTWEPEADGLVRSEVSVDWSGKNICTLNTAVYVEEAAP